MQFNIKMLGLVALTSMFACQPAKREFVKPVVVTEPVQYDSDDPAIWEHPTEPSKSLILGTDKHEVDGAIYVFDLNGKIDPNRKAYPLDRPNNVDVIYDFPYGNDTIDIAVCTERGKGQIRVFKLPELTAIDGGGIKVFEDDLPNNLAMGVALYQRKSDLATYAIVTRKEGTTDLENYLRQYQLTADSTGVVTGSLVRKFGKFSGTKEIEAIAVDHKLGFIYYSDEHAAIRQYHADPEMGNDELSVFGEEGFADDREGISIYETSDSTGFILVSDQGANQFQVYRREGTEDNPYYHEHVATIPVQAVSSDGSEVSETLITPAYPKGIFIAMSDNKTFEFYSWADLETYLK